MAKGHHRRIPVRKQLKRSSGDLLPDTIAEKGSARCNGVLTGLLLAVSLLPLLLGGCQSIPFLGYGTANPGDRLPASAKGGEGPGINPLELQALVMGMADDYSSDMAEIVYLMLKPSARTPEERVLAQSYIRNSFGASTDIAAGQNPEVGFLDLLVLISLQRASFERHWMPEVWGEARGRPALERLKKLEADMWHRSAFLLNEQQRGMLRHLIDEWLANNPDRFVVELVRFDQFDDARYIINPEKRAAARGLLKEVGEAVNAIDDAMLLAERALWYSGRLSFILGQQAELTTYRILSDPQIEETLTAISGYYEVFDRGVKAVELFPELWRVQQLKLEDAVTAEREAAIDHFFQRLHDERKLVIRDTSALIDQLFWRLLVIIGVLFLIFLFVRFIPRFQRSAGANKPTG